MKSLEESIAISMDGKDTAIVEHLPYILQDICEIGAAPETIIELIEKHELLKPGTKVLDLGCGKGAVSIKLAKHSGCSCFGFDAIKGFIEEAKCKAREYNVNHLCKFEVSDIRIKVKELSGFDIIVLGAIGPVLGNYEETIKILEKCLNETGVLIIDDGYLNDNFQHPVIQKRPDVLKQIEKAGFKIIDELFVTDEEITDMDNYIFDNLKKRCEELIDKFPSQKELFINYIKSQEEENEVIENKLTCSTMLLARK